MGISFYEVSHSYPGLKKKETVDAIKNINLNINETGEFVCIVGQTGSGKSTLVQHMNALLLPTMGYVDILGAKITPKAKKNPKLKPIRKNVGFVFQFPEYQLFEETVLKDIVFAPKIFGMSAAEADSRAKEVANMLGISDLLDKSPFNLSGGQMRKVAIAGILAYNPSILLLDEPTRGLDPKGQKEIMDMFYELHTTTNKTTIVITHDMDIVYRYATRVIVMKDKEIFFDGTPNEVFGSDIYKESHLLKPQILSLIDYLNEKMGYNLKYEYKTEDELIKALGGIINE